jgi:hypothetical protein
VQFFVACAGHIRSAVALPSGVERARMFPRIIAAILLLLTAPLSAFGQEVELPAGVKPLTGSVDLRFRPMKHFTYSLSVTMRAGTDEKLIEATAIEGMSEAEGNGLIWTYAVYDIEHDGGRRELGSVRVKTGLWGEVRDVDILSSKIPPVEQGAEPEEYPLLAKDKTRFKFPLRRLPHEALEMNGSFPARGKGSKSVVAGILEEGGLTCLAIRHAGNVVVETKGASGGMAVQGYSLIDMATGLTVKEIYRVVLSLGDAGAFVIDEITTGQY